MTKFSMPLATCATALLSGAPALADVTASEVWESWQEMMQMGGDVTVELGREDVDPGRVTVEDAVYTYTTDTDETVVTIDRIELVGNDDGTVTLTMAEAIPVIFDSADGGRAELTVQQTGLQTTVSGTPDAMTYDVTADRYEIRTDRVLGPNGQPQDVSVLFALNALSGGYDQASGEVMRMDYAIQSGSADLLVDFTDPESGDEVMFSGKIDALGFEAIASLPQDADTTDMDGMIAQGFAMTAGYSYDAAAYIFSVDGDGTASDGTATTGAGGLSFDLSEDGMSYGTETQDVSVEVQGTELPFPIRASAASYGTGITTPVVPTEAPVPYGVRFSLQDVTMGDEVWSMLDPQGRVPRDPASLNIDISGEARLEQSLFADPDAMSNQGSLGTLETLNINDISLALAGANLDAIGAFTFDPEGLFATPGLGSPVGTVTVDVTGANQLIDTAIAMGLVPADQAMMGRMMLGMFATPVGEDALQSVIEVTPDGRVIANGQQIR